MPGTNTPTDPSMVKTLSTKTVTVAGSTVVIAPLVPFFWNQAFPHWQMGPEVAAAAAGVVAGFLGFVYAVVYKILLKYGVAP